MNDIMLIVDDIEINREILKIIFNKQYEILEAENGEEALAILEGCKDSINVVLLDLMMPGYSGFEVLEKRKEMEYFRKIPVVVITGSEHMEDQVKAFDLGANEYISKPFVPEIVLSRVNNVMASNKKMIFMELEAKKMKIKSEVDEMTGLYNKVTTEFSMDGILRESKNSLDVMMVIDIDNFKAVNDLLGHQTGDHVIKVIANVISRLFRRSDIIGRIGGDEFCVLMVDVPDMEIVYSKINELIQKMKYKPNMTIPEYVTLSIGVSTNDKKNISYADMFKMADSALYEAKLGGKAQYREFGVELVPEEEDNRPVSILLSNSRSVCSTIQALIPTYVRIVEVESINELNNINDNDKEKSLITFVDISDKSDDESDYWDKLKPILWINFDYVFAICEEGNTEQYLSALKSGVSDVITTPIDGTAFNRRIMKKLENGGIIDSVLHSK